MRAAELGPVPPQDRRQSALDLFFIFAGANIVSTTLQVGAALAAEYSFGAALGLIAAGSVVGSALVGALAPLGPRLGVPSVIAARAALGTRGAGAVALLLYVTNFAWIAVNNVIASSVCAQALGLVGSERLWALALGLGATAIVARGPRAVGLADRLAVPLMLIVGAVLTWACLRMPLAPQGAAAGTSGPLLRGLDIVIGYQVSWLLMFADYSRYTPSERKSLVSVFLGLALTSLWFMPIGLLGARAAGTNDPGAMILATGVGTWGALLIALATLTTNFVNIYLSSLAWKSLLPKTGDQISIWSIGAIGTTLGLFSSAWLNRYADFMLVLGSVLVPVGAILLAHFFVLRRAPRVEDLYDMRGPYARHGGFSVAGITAWVAGTAAYHLASGFGSTIVSFVVAGSVYVVIESGIRGQGPGVSDEPGGIRDQGSGARD